MFSILFRTKLPKQRLQAHHSGALKHMIEFQAAQSESNEINTVLKNVPARDTKDATGALSTIGKEIERFASHCLADLLNCRTGAPARQAVYKTFVEVFDAEPHPQASVDARHPLELCRAEGLFIRQLFLLIFSPG